MLIRKRGVFKIWKTLDHLWTRYSNIQWGFISGCRILLKPICTFQYPSFQVTDEAHRRITRQEARAPVICMHPYNIIFIFFHRKAVKLQILSTDRCSGIV